MGDALRKSSRAETYWDALRTIGAAASELRERRRFDWPQTATQCVHRLRLEQHAPALPRIVALVGGASSGKSTIFNNLLEGRLVSRIAARGHSTYGLILAVHENDRERVSPLLQTGALLPGFSSTTATLDGDVTGSPDTITLVHHHIAALAGVVLADTPDYTSDAARREGDVTLSQLPWFDDLLVVVDQERWFDRQAFGTLSDASGRYGQRRLVLFNRSREETLGPTDREAFAERGRRLGADDIVIIEFRRGRGLCRFPPDTLDPIRQWLRATSSPRTHSLRSVVVRGAEHVLNQNDERLHRLTQLRQCAEAALARTSPSGWDTLTALLTVEERRQMDVVARVMRLRQTTEWISDQGRRLQSVLSSIPGLSLLWTRPALIDATSAPAGSGRRELAIAFAQASIRRTENELRRIHTSSAFWSEIRRWTGIEPPLPSFPGTDDFVERVANAADRFDQAVDRWTAKVESECRGIGTSLHGAIGVGAIGLAAVLIAVPGPIAAITLVTAKSAIAGALAHLAVAGGTGFLVGKPLGRLAAVIREKLAGSAEFNAVRSAAEQVHAIVHLEAGARLAHVLDLARAMVMDEADPVRQALESVRQWGADDHA